MSKPLKVKVYTRSWVARVLLALSPATTFTLGCFIFSAQEEISPLLLRHELIHVAQYQRHGVFKFLWRYFGKELLVPYRKKTFEKEAYKFESDPNYLAKAYPEFKFTIVDT